MLKLYYILNKILNIKFPPCKYKIPPGGEFPPGWEPLAYVEHNAQGTSPHHGFSLLINIECALSLCVQYPVGCLDDITFQIEWLLMDQSQKSLRHFKTQISSQPSHAILWT